MPSRTKGTPLLAAAIAASVLMFVFSAVAQTNDNSAEGNPSITRLLAQARDDAATLSRDADEMESLTRSDVTWQTHAETLNRFKDDANKLARDVEQLVALRDSAAPWQQQAIDRMVPLLRELAAHTTAAINLLNASKSRPTSPDYAEFLKVNSQTAHELADIISSYYEYGQAVARLQKLEQNLEVARK